MNLRKIPMAVSATVLWLSSISASAQQPGRQPHTGELLRAIERLAVVGNVLYVAAHPDDENTRLLSYLHGERLLRTAYLSLTRGDGGQNLIGAEQGPLLGLIRTQELLAARRVDGAEQFFTRARDFGYSKTPAETLAIWNKEAVLWDLVWVIRRFHPDVIITRFQAQGGDTHGHHTASAILAQEAFRAAANSAIYPEQVRQVGTWQAQRIYWNRSVWGGKPSDELLSLPKLDVGGYNPLLGVSYGELSAESRSMHKSQGFGSSKSRGPTFEYFQRLLSLETPSPAEDIFAGIDLTWGRVKGGAKLAQLLEKARKDFDPRRPEGVISTLLLARAELMGLPESPWKAPKLAELEQVIAACAGIYAEVSASDSTAVPGGSLEISAAVISRRAVPLRLREVRLPGAAVPVDKPLGENEPWQAERTITVPKDAAISNPYWLAEPPGPGLYTVSDPALIGRPEDPPALSAEFLLTIGPGTETLRLVRPVLYKWTDPVAGERYRAVAITPEVMVNPEAPVLMFPDSQARPLRVRLKAGAEKVAGTLRLELPAGFAAEPPSAPFRLDKKGAEEELRFLLRPATAGQPAGQPQATPGTLRVVAEVGEQRLSRGTLSIDYPHIPIQTLFPQAEVKLCRFELKKTRTKIGYIAGAGDEVAAALRQVGFEVTLLTEAELEQKPAAGLRQFGAIVVGVRAYNTNPRMQFYTPRLLDYVAAGGNLIVQYNTNNRLSKLAAPIGPYPFEISQDRVTDENAAVTVQPAGHPLLSQPNRITDADFQGWVQERGLYFADKWSDKYEAPLSMQDPGEPPKKGGLLLARHGKGAFIYTGLAFFRQLPAGVAGAYRLFANLISYGQNGQ